jgi:hypothetical protein
MTPTKASPELNFISNYSSQLLNRPQEKTTLVNLSEIKIPAEKRIPRATMYFPMSRAASRMSFAEWQNPRLNFKSLGDNAEILSEAGFSEEQISGILSGSGSRLSERVDRLAKFTQPKIEHYDEVICLLPSELEYLLRAGLSQDHIANMLLESGGDLSANIEALKDFVTPSIQCTNEKGISGVRSPLQVLEELGKSKDSISNFLSKLTHLNLELRIKKVLYLIHCTKNVVFKDLFKDKDARAFSIFDTDGMTLEDAHEILALFGTGSMVRNGGMTRNYSEESFLSDYSDSMTIDGAIEDENHIALDDKNHILEIFNSFADKT